MQDYYKRVAQLSALIYNANNGSTTYCMEQYINQKEALQSIFGEFGNKDYSRIKKFEYHPPTPQLEEFPKMLQWKLSIYLN